MAKATINSKKDPPASSNKYTASMSGSKTSAGSSWSQSSGTSSSTPLHLTQNKHLRC
jgi:hypothetical protein